MMRIAISYWVYAWLIVTSLTQTVQAQSDFGATPNSHPKTGVFTLEMELSEIAPDDQLSLISTAYQDQTQMSFSLFVPEGYDPANPPGILVYISPAKTESVPRSWRRVLEEENLIFISANGAGNKAQTNRRLFNAMLASRAVNMHYETDPDRRYLSGFSGGARVSSIAVETMPNFFNGAIFIGGAFNWHGDPQNMEAILNAGSYVFITGRKDQARPEVLSAYRQYKNIETAHVTLIDNQRLGHELPKAKMFRQALGFLSSEEKE